MIIASSASTQSGSMTKVHTVEDVKNGLDCEIFAYIIDSKYQDIQLVIQKRSLIWKKIKLIKTNLLVFAK